jgi:hypothetical protein
MKNFASLYFLEKNSTFLLELYLTQPALIHLNLLKNRDNYDSGKISFSLEIENYSA